MPQMPGTSRVQHSAPRKLVNRGPAGLLNKAPAQILTQVELRRPVAPINHIAQELRDKGLIVSIANLTPDPMNARIHPERNLEAIKTSLQEYKQCSPITVRRNDNVIMKGNGTVTAALELGWTEIAAIFVDMDEATSAGYALADNRTSELARWDFEVIAKLDKLISETGHVMVGWSLDELEVLRACDWTPPIIDENATFGQVGEKDPLLVSFTPDQYESVSKAIALLRQTINDPEMDQAECLMHICKDWSDNATNAR